MDPTISCLIPVYNGARYLELALDSILAQTFADFEIVAVNDGSTDESLAILEDYAKRDRRLRIVSKPNGGIVSALNIGLQHCAGTYIARMDCDDIATPERFSIQVASFMANPEAVAVGGLIQTIDDDGEAIAPPGSPSRVERTDLSSFPPVVANVQHSAGTFRRDAMLAVGGYRSGFPHAEDYDLYLRLADHGTFINPPHLVLYYRVHSGSLSMRNLERQETSAVLAELSAFARQEGATDPGNESTPLGVQDYAAALAPHFQEETVRRYIAFRLWRRLAGAGSENEASHRRSVIRGLLTGRNYATRLDRSLNRRIVLSMGRKLVRIARHDPMKLIGRGSRVELAR